MINLKVIAFSCLLTTSALITPALSQQDIDLSKIPTINNTDWRTPSTFSPPWSTPVLVNDEFDGTYLTVFDKNFQRPWGSNVENGIISNWSRKALRIYSYIQVDGSKVATKETSGVTVKVGGKAYPLTGTKGNYPVTAELAYALKTAPTEVAKIKVEFADSGIPLVSDIGVGTVSSWKVVYRDAKAPGQVSSSNSSKVTQAKIVKQKRTKSR